MPYEFKSKQDYLDFLHGRGYGIVPCRVSVNGAVWDQDAALFERLQAENPDVSIAASRPAERAKECTRRDNWGCLWHYPGLYLDGQVIGHPLDDWIKLSTWRPPNPDDHADWNDVEKAFADARRNGHLPSAGFEHGFLYLKLTYLRGFENFMLDLAERRPELYRLRDLVTDYWVCVLRRYLDLGAEFLSFGDDLGHQHALPIHPAAWREFLKPAFRRVFEPCRRTGAEVFLHTDGYIVDIIPDLIEIGVTVLNPQDIVNGVQTLARVAKGKVSLDLDVDRQRITAFGTPAEIDDHIRACIQTLGSPGGGLQLKFGAYPGTPVDNVAQVARSMQNHHRLWVDDRP